jgi:hypothetical protein
VCAFECVLSFFILSRNTHALPCALSNRMHATLGTPGWSYAPPVSSTNSHSVGGVAGVGGSSATGTASTVGAVVAVAVVVVAVAVIISKRRTRAAKMSQSAAISDQMEWSGGDGLDAMTKSLEVSEDVSV